ncbi:Cysteine-rich secretory protein LCCL domain-containing 1 [Liparis tanakae]|uniref:Cysteine-rich secretory protein LCCL domain-containing 1 n=1 Tax=Liparis tanakae TaxID=230148 RepID=A0A4Z2IGY9_9TELE|nr:Cysteine-rich secretory protein LCCL domain-containing 1 [Liparis tanakae]
MKRSLPFAGWVGAASLFLCLTQTVLTVVLTNSTKLESILDKYRDNDEEWWRARSRGRRAISEGDMHLILDLHNKLRGQVHPPASNMEYMLCQLKTAEGKKDGENNLQSKATICLQLA